MYLWIEVANSLALWGSSIHLVALLKEKHLKKYGMDLILKPIVRDLKELVSMILTCTFVFWSIVCHIS